MEFCFWSSKLRVKPSRGDVDNTKLLVSTQFLSLCCQNKAARYILFSFRWTLRCASKDWTIKTSWTPGLFLWRKGSPDENYHSICWLSCATKSGLWKDKLPFPNNLFQFFQHHKQNSVQPKYWRYYKIPQHELKFYFLLRILSLFFVVGKLTIKHEVTTYKSLTWSRWIG